jgi:uncharacterized Zn-finger protein
MSLNHLMINPNSKTQVNSSTGTNNTNNLASLIEETSQLEEGKKKYFHCDHSTCSKKYTQKFRLDIHKRTHTGEKPYECTICHKTFTEKGNLKVHTRIHTGEKPYKCDYQGCSAAFKAYGHLKDHINIHLNIKPFKCNICGYEFSRKSSLVQHMLIHTKEKPFKCPVCKALFRERSNLNKHMKTVHGIIVNNNDEYKILPERVSVNNSSYDLNSNNLSIVAFSLSFNINK